MNDEQTNPPEVDELRDRLVDRGLRELLCGETPSDLSERILASSGHQPAIATQTLGGEAMSGNEIVGGRSKSRWRWAQFAVAATLLIGLSAAFLANQVKDVESARRITVASPSQTATVPQSTAPAGGKQTGAQPATGQPAVRAAAVPAESKESADFDELVDLIESTEESLTWHDESAEPEVAPNLSIVTSQTQQVHDGQEAAAPGQQDGQSNYTLDLGAPFRQGSFGLSTPSTGAPEPKQLAGKIVASDGALIAYPDSGDWQELSERRKDRYASTELFDTDSSSTIHYYSNAPRGARVWHRTYGWGYEVKGGALRGDAEGIGPELGGDKYTQIVENAFRAVSASNTDNRLSTFSIDVDTASYANVRQFLMQSQTLPPPDAVRIEELVNYFDYDYTAPTGDVPFAANVEVAGCPWDPDHRLVRVGIKGREMERSKRPQSNLVFLIDVSGSMDEPNKLPLLVEGMKLLTRELGENDRVAIVVYASSEGLALSSTPGTDQSRILAALDQLAAGGSTAGGAGIQLAYQMAADNFIKGGVNRVILCTDGDFNVGVTSPAELERMAESKAKDTGVFLTVLGFGRGNLNDAMMEQIADKGNGNYHYVDTRNEARKVLVEEMAGTLVTIAKDVKIQIEFNPAKVAGYRLIGYENRVLAAEDFNDDKKDAGEIGAGHTVTALYETVPAGKEVKATKVDDLKYAPPTPIADADDEPTYNGEEASDELLTLKIRYKAPDGDKSSKLEFPITDSGQSFAKATDDLKFASAVASFGMLLRGSEFKGNATYAAVAEIAEAASKNRDPHGRRKEFVEMVQRAKELSGE